ncbi:MAG: hypothetical protein A2Y61_07735 [Chloroflexi bacterium RBG_13_60_13]|nr:MAG: hypothetical protein A2Y61_07735 [Chloroflexi bacterium RBG_13_60_13]
MVLVGGGVEGGEEEAQRQRYQQSPLPFPLFRRAAELSPEQQEGEQGELSQVGRDGCSEGRRRSQRPRLGGQVEDEPHPQDGRQPGEGEPSERHSCHYNRRGLFVAAL